MGLKEIVCVCVWMDVGRNSSRDASLIDLFTTPSGVSEAMASDI